VAISGRPIARAFAIDRRGAFNLPDELEILASDREVTAKADVGRSRGHAETPLVVDTAMCPGSQQTRLGLEANGAGRSTRSDVLEER
jgi:hypothetical protein